MFYKLLLSVAFACFFIFPSYAQKSPFTLTIDSVAENRFRLSLFNNSDSILCMVTSSLIQNKAYRTDNVLKLIPLKLVPKRGYYYSPSRTIANLDFSGERLTLSAIAILPSQLKQFDFSISEESHSNIFLLKYFLLSAYDHGSFLEEISFPNWFAKYKLLETELPFGTQ